MADTLLETRDRVVESAASGRLRVAIITPGWGSSGYYSESVIKEAADNKIFPAGTHLFMDHPSETEEWDRPERSVRDLAAVLRDDARWDANENALIGDVQLIGPYRESLSDPELLNAIGLSIRASGEFSEGEAEGRKGRIVTKLLEGLSVDFVTRAGRGGKVLQILESARNRAAESLTRETFDLLRRALGDAGHIIDFDPEESSVVYLDWSTEPSKTFRDQYEVSDGSATLAGNPVEVRQVTSFVPVDTTSSATESTTDPDVPAPAGQPNEESDKEDIMPQIEEARLRQLEEDAGRVTALESERDTAVSERDNAIRERDQLRARESARPVVTTALEGCQLPASAQRRVTENALRNIPLAEDGSVDEDKLRSQVEKAREAEESEVAAILKAAGVGAVTGFGGSNTDNSNGFTEADVDKQIATTFGRTIKEA